MLHILLYKIKKTEAKAKIDAEKAGKGNEGSHEILIGEINAHLAQVNKKDVFTFNTNILTLKRLRKKSDYADLEIIDTESRKCIEKAIEVNKILKKAI